MNFRAHNYETARAAAAKKSEETGKKTLPVLGYSNGVPHVLLESGEHRRIDHKRRDVSGKVLRRERLAQRAKFRDYRNDLIAKFGEAKAKEIIDAAIASAKASQPRRAQ
jgi:tRNA G37 N-methylase TrmD